MKSLIILLIFLLSCGITGAVTLDSTTVLNATGSNSVITFSSTVTADQVVVESTSITLTNVSCANGNSVDSYVFNTVNTTIDSANICADSEVSQGGPVGGSKNPALPEERVNEKDLPSLSIAGERPADFKDFVFPICLVIVLGGGYLLLRKRK